MPSKKTTDAVRPEPETRPKRPATKVKRRGFFGTYVAAGWYRRFLEYFFVSLLILCVAVLTKRLGQADILGDQGLGKSLNSILSIADILYHVGNSMESNYPLIVAFILAFAAAKRPNSGVALAVLAAWSGYAGATTALSQYLAGASAGAVTEIDLGVFGGVLIGFITAISWSMFRFRRVTIWARMVSGIPLVIVIAATAGVILGILMGVFFQILYLVVAVGIGSAILNAPEPVAAALYAFLHPIAEVTGWSSLLDIAPFKTYGSCQAPSGDTIKGSYNCFIYGAHPLEGQQALFLAGGYPVVCFGLTTLFLVIWLQLKGETRQYWRILYLLVVISTFLTGADKVGIYLLAFAAPGLLVAHMVGAAVSYAVTAVFMVTIGWTGGPGVVDLLRWSQTGSGMLILLILGVFFAAVYLIFGLLAVRRRGKTLLFPGFGVPYITKPFMGIPKPAKKPDAAFGEATSDATEKKDSPAPVKTAAPKMAPHESEPNAAGNATKAVRNASTPAAPAAPAAAKPEPAGAKPTESVASNPADSIAASRPLAPTAPVATPGNASATGYPAAGYERYEGYEGAAYNMPGYPSAGAYPPEGYPPQGGYPMAGGRYYPDASGRGSYPVGTYPVDGRYFPARSRSGSAWEGVAPREAGAVGRDSNFSGASGANGASGASNRGKPASSRHNRPVP